MPITFRSGESLGAAKARHQSTSAPVSKPKRKRSVRGGATKAAEKAITKKNNAATVLPDPPKANKKVSPKVTPAPKAPAPKVAKKAAPKKVTLVEKPKAKAAAKASIAPTENKKATTAGKAAIKIKETKPANMGTISDKENAERANPKGGKPKAEQGTKSVLQKADEVLDLADVYEGKFQRDTLAKGLPEKVKAGIAKAKPKVSVLPQAPVKPTATEKAKQAMTSDAAYKLPAKETVHPMGSASAKSVSEKKVSPKVTPPPSKAVPAKKETIHPMGSEPAKSVVKDKPAPKVSLVAKSTGDPRNEPTAHQSTSAPKKAEPTSRLDSKGETPTESPNQVLAKANAKSKGRALPKGGVSKAKQDKVANPTERHTTLLGKFQGEQAKSPEGVNAEKYKELAGGKKDGILGDKYRNDDVSYNQAYWASKLAEGKAAGNKDIQTELAAEQKKIGMKKAYSGDKVVQEDDRRRGKYILDSLEKSGIEPKVETKGSGLLDENTTTTKTYDIGTGTPIVVTEKGNSPTLEIGGKTIRLGDDTGTTYVDGVATWDSKGQGDNESFSTSELGTMGDQAKIEPIEAQNNLDSINDEIANTTDPAKLKSLYQRRLKLMRLLSTKTRHSNLLGLADTKRANLLGIL